MTACLQHFGVDSSSIIMAVQASRGVYGSTYSKALASLKSFTADQIGEMEEAAAFLQLSSGDTFICVSRMTLTACPGNCKLMRMCDCMCLRTAESTTANAQSSSIRLSHDKLLRHTWTSQTMLECA